MENAANRIALTGALDTLPEYSHTNHNRNFYRLTLCVERLSGAVDLLPVLAAEDVLNEADLFRGERIAITGQVRSFNNRAPEGRRLIISVYAETLTTTDQPAQNDVSLTGSVCKPPIYRRTPLGREICDVMLAVPRPYRRTDYIPCILWGRSAQEAASALPGSKLHVTGRLQSRDTSRSSTARASPARPTSSLSRRRNFWRSRIFRNKKIFQKPCNPSPVFSSG